MFSAVIPGPRSVKPGTGNKGFPSAPAPVGGGPRVGPPFDKGMRTFWASANLNVNLKITPISFCLFGAFPGRSHGHQGLVTERTHRLPRARQVPGAERPGAFREG